MMTIKHWPKKERPREKLIYKGAEHLSDAELLAIFLRTGVKGKTAIDLARELLLEHKNLQKLLNLDLDQFCRIKGLGLSKYCQLKAILEISRRYLFENVERQKIFDSTDETKQYLVSEFSNLERETFGCLFLDNQYRMLAFETLFRGSINRMNIYPREVIKIALKHNAAAVIFVHNHPSGSLKPSQLDINLTKKLRDILFQIDIKVLDHVIVGKNRATSLVEEGYF